MHNHSLGIRFLLVFILPLILVTSGCGSGTEAKRVACEENFARMDLDGELAKTFYTQRYIDENPGKFAEISGGYSSWRIPVPVEQRPSMSELMDKFTCRVQGTTAYVQLKEEYRTVSGDTITVLVNTGGTWKIDRFE